MRVAENAFLVCAAMPMGLIADEPGQLVPIRGALPEGVLGEVRIHQAIYARRPDVGGVCRIMPPALMALSTMGIVPRPRHGIGAYFAPEPAYWDDPRLLRDVGLAGALADRMADRCAIVMRGNGAVVVGESIEQAAVLSWFLEDAARIEKDVRSMGAEPDEGLLTPEEVVARQVWSGGVVARMWQWLCREG